jgi:pilus assembly protein CpaC
MLKKMNSFGHRCGLLVAALSVMPLVAQTVTASAADRVVKVSSSKTERIKVAKGKPQTIQTSAAFYEIVLGDPDVANVSPLTDRSFYILGNELGTTGIALFDEDKRLVGTIDIEVTLDTDQLQTAIKKTVPDSKIEITSANGRVVMSGKAKDAVDAERAKNIAENFSGSEAIINGVTIDSSQQVQLNVRFVEVARTAGVELSSKIGASYNFGSGSVSFNSDPAGLGTNPLNAIVGQVVSGGLTVDATIKALEDKGMARRLAEPNLIARSGEEASFLAGGEIPIPVAQDNGSITYIFKKYGVSLAFRPVVLKDGLISLDIEPEVSSIDASETFSVGAGISVPSFVVRRAKTSIDLKSGQSFMMAGLIQSQNDVVRSNVPGVGRVPVIGSLFASKQFQRRETELVIIVTPHLVQPIDPTKKVRTPADRTVSASAVDVILGDVDEIKTSDINKVNQFGKPTATAIDAGSAGGHFLDLGEE